MAIRRITCLIFCALALFYAMLARLAHAEKQSLLLAVDARTEVALNLIAFALLKIDTNNADYGLLSALFLLGRLL